MRSDITAPAMGDMNQLATIVIILFHAIAWVPPKINPNPKIDPTIEWVVDTGIPKKEAK